MNEFRRAKRRQVPDLVQVVDTMTDEVMGRIGNLSETGMLMIGRGPGVEDGLFQVRFELPARGGLTLSLDVGAHQLWVEANPASGTFWSGFRFIDISASDAQRLREWIDEPGSAYA